MAPEISAIFLIVGLFMLGVISPGPNFLVVAERSMASGFRAGVATGLGVATGDAFFAAVGLLGLATLVPQAGWLFSAIKILGGLYIAWIGLSLLRRSRRAGAVPVAANSEPVSTARCFRVGLLTDLSNPKTVVFFASIFAAAYDPALPAWVTAAMWGGIVASSIVWRTGLAAAFSRGYVRTLYARFRRSVETLFGAVLILFGLRLALSGRPR